jgi:hypothetical protein
MGGVVLGLAGFGAIALAQVSEGPPWALRELGGVLGGLGAMLLMWGIQAGLPAHRALRVIGLFGAGIGALGLAAFVWAYPEQWGRPGRPDQVVPVMATYVTGLVLMVAATFGALVADFVLRMQVRGRLRGELGRDPTDDEIQRDIDEALRRHKVTWGGLMPVEGKGLKVKVEAVPAEWADLMPKIGRETIASGERVAPLNDAVDSLVKFRGGRNKTSDTAEAGLGDAAGALAALRTARAVQPKRTWLDRLLRRKPTWAPPPGWELQGQGPPGPKP